MRGAVSFFIWAGIGLAGGFCYWVLATARSESISAVYILVAALCTYVIGYRFYSAWIAAKVLTLNERRATPCEVHEDGHDYVKTNKWIVFGHHFAAISGPGPLVGPVLAAQFGYLPGTLWILIGVVLGGAVQDFIILFASIRRDGKSLGEMVRDEIGSLSGVIAALAIVSIMVILIAVLGLVVVKALAHSPWGTFTIAATMPLAIFMGLYLRFIRPGRVLEVSAIGVVLLLLSVWVGKFFHEIPALSAIMTWDGKTLALAVIGYGLAASVLPVWLLLAPRDYLSTFMKLGTIGALGIGILIVLPELRMPPLTRFIDGTGPIFAGNVFPFCFITIACGAISGFHSLIASGTTPKIITRETYARPIGYGSMLLESSVAIMAMIAACSLDPGVYFAINSPAAIVGSTPEQITATITGWGFPVTAETMRTLAIDLGEATMFGRAGGAPTLAVGMALIFAKFLGGKGLLALWYHFAIMFEALFILTTLDAGTRVGRFILQALLGQVIKPLGNLKSLPAGAFTSVLFVAAWGFFLMQGVLDPLGGINSLWPLFGIANQLLSVIAMCLATTILLKMRKNAFVLITLLPLVWLVSVTFTAGIQKIFHTSPQIGFLAQANQLSAALARGLVPPEKIGATKQIIFNMHMDALVAGVFLVFVALVVLASVWRWVAIFRGSGSVDLHEAPAVLLTPEQLATERTPAFSGSGAAFVFAFELARQLTGQNAMPEKPATDGAVAHSHAGEAWARSQEERFKRPRCC